MHSSKHISGWQSVLKKFFKFLLVLSVLTTPVHPVSVSASDRHKPEYQQAQDLLARLSPAEKVGQLFIVTFKGTDLSESSQVYALINQNYIGGVMLQQSNDNFTGGDTTLQSAYDLIGGLQTSRWQSSQNRDIEDPRVTYIPLMIGLSQEGDGAPYSQILSGLMQLPNQMALAATWNPQLVESSGQILGRELAGLGVNLLVGPSLDVLDTPLQEGSEELGTRTFGGDPYWVGEMGKAFIRGVHTGSADRVALISTHFPGRGGADRQSDVEVATVRKSLEQLKQIELAPFFSVTGNATTPQEVTDGLLISHIRYQGFQGNVRVTTRPVSFDPAALTQILSLPEFVSWRESGGIVISDDLGSDAVRKFTDPTLSTFDSKQVARNALLAGIDLLYVDDFTASGDPDSYTSIVRTLNYFTQKYIEDPAFAQRVDAAVTRILEMKYRLYPTFTLDTVLPRPLEGNNTAGNQQVILDIAQQSAARVNPSEIEIASILPDPPSARERIVFLMDETSYRQCSSCEEQFDLGKNSLKNVVQTLYGPESGGPMNPSRLSAYSFAELTAYLDGKTAPENLVYDITNADWVVVGIQKPDASRPESYAFKRLLSERPDLLRSRRVVVFGFNAPYYLDATDISGISAYYALYSKNLEFIELAARILFQEFTPRSAPPVSVPGIGYDLSTATLPDPAQLIPLELDVSNTTESTPTPDMAGSVVVSPVYRLGDTIPLRTGVIMDHNQHQVPDGTLVRFIIRTGTDATTTQQIEATTSRGIARALYRITSNGFIEIRAASDPALLSTILQLDIPVGEGAGVTAIAPTPMPSETPVPSPTALLPETGETDENTVPTEHPGFLVWMLAMMMVSICAYGAYSIGRKLHSIRWGIRWAFCTVIGGVFSYFYIVAGMPGGDAWLELAGTGGLFIVLFIFMSLGLAVGVFWHAVLGRPGN